MGINKLPRYIGPSPDEESIGMLDAYATWGNGVEAPALAGSVAAVNKSTNILHIYANGDTGDDSNDGLTSSTPKKTLQASFDMLPDTLYDDVVIHLRGTFAPEGTAVAINSIKPLLVTDVVFDGGHDEVDILSGPHVSTDPETSTTEIGTGTLSMTVDEYAGYWLEILDGALAGDRYNIVENDATSFTPATNFSSDPGAGVSYRIIKPSTTIDGTSGFNILRFQATGTSNYWLQNLYVDGPSARIFASNGCALSFAGVIWNGGIIQTYDVSFYTGIWYQKDIVDPDIQDTTQRLGFSQMSTSEIKVVGSNSPLFSGAYLKNVEVSGARNLNLKYGSRVDGQFRLIGSSPDSTTAISSSSGYATTKITNSSSSGLYVLNSAVHVGAIDISDSTTHGIEVDNSRLILVGAISGSGNGGAGVYAHANSFVTFPDGTPPTIGGDNIQVSVDGTTQASTWAAIDAGTPVVDATEQTTIKEQ